jgi:hypothetical protein
LSVQRENWKTLTLSFNDDLNDASQQQHHASQFIALVGRYLIPQQPDDSNTNMQYLLDKEMLVGNALANGMRLALQLTDLTLYILDKDNKHKSEISLVGKITQQVFEEVKQTFAEFGVDTSNLKNELHYEVPTHDLINGDSFTIKEKKLFQENTFYRHNADLILNEIAAGFEDTDSVRVWPHHFDTGTFIPFTHNDKGELSQSIGIGWTIPDSMVNEPYYYLSFWSEQPVESFEALTPLEVGEWITTGWKGGVLKLSEILQCSSASEQQELVKTFFNSGIKILTKHFKK